MPILDHYILTRPSSQNALDLFDGEWSSQMPAGSGLTTRPGPAALFEDARIDWAAERLGGFMGKTVLELGPLEGGHAYMAQKGGATRVTSIEANTRCYLKCLCVKEVLRLDRVDFLLGDFLAYLDNSPPRFDLALASGVLYHMEDPIRLLRALGRVADKAFIWTHFYDEAVITGSPSLRTRFSAPKTMQVEGKSYAYATQSYQGERSNAAFCGGAMPVSNWLTREGLLAAIRDAGFTNLEVGFENPGHPNGPSLAVCASR